MFFYKFEKVKKTKKNTPKTRIANIINDVKYPIKNRGYSRLILYEEI